MKTNLEYLISDINEAITQIIEKSGGDDDLVVRALINAKDALRIINEELVNINRKLDSK